MRHLRAALGTGHRALAVPVLALLVCVALSACRNDTLEEVPELLIGTWETDDPPYADRFFEITASEITLGLGGSRRETHQIVEIRAESADGGRTLYTLVYVDQTGTTNTMYLYVEPTEPPTLRLKNRVYIAWHPSS